MEQNCLDLQGLGVSSFWGIKETDAEYVVIDLRNNALRTFEHFGTHPKLVELRLQNNQIESFMGLTKQPSLAVVDLDGSPIAAHPWYRVMALLVVGFSITAIDGVAVSENEREMARGLGPIAALAVSYGWKLQPGERSPEEYRQIIAECKKARKRALQQQQGPFQTIALALRQNRSTGALLPYLSLETSIGSDSTAWNLELLLARVKKLENLLSEAQDKLDVQQARWRDLVDLGQVEGITGAELCSARSILFTDGIYLRTNVMASPPHERNGQTRGSVMLEGSSLVLLSFMSRVRLAESALCDIKVGYCPPSALRIEGAYGAVFEISFDNALSLWAVYKLLYLRRGMPVPPLHLKDEVEVNAMLKREATAQMTLNNAENGGTSSNLLNEKREPRKEHASPQGIIGTVTSSSSGRNSLPEKKKKSPLGDSPPPEVRDVQPASDPRVSPVENFLLGSVLGEGSCSRSVADLPELRAEEYLEASCTTSEALRARTLSLSRSQPPPPSRLPRRSCSCASPPSIPRRHPSSSRTSAVLKGSNAVVSHTRSPGDEHSFHIRRLRVAVSDSDSDSDSLAKLHLEKRM
ncbi:uncharacterized protein Tco025E_01957 [Trypanosoma conorhini]|uniref:Uncharacterized protein n=1 Tax=Trypanosoma conorhini TaxID=83891 RepID=A0A422Q714_9TRYP|nr:uncharacterized protein Tco025E_01957 [Trypanosoma conorhini]RNF25765.1 hypothetical protein Tco025E_01957 [Trypanosoma conorhini]